MGFIAQVTKENIAWFAECQLVFLDFSLWCCSRLSELVIIWSMYFIRILLGYVFQLYRPQKLEMLRRVMGADGNHDPDPTYEFTIDNMKKLLAIHMRLRYSCMITGFLARFILLFKRITIIIIKPTFYSYFKESVSGEYHM